MPLFSLSCSSHWCISKFKVLFSYGNNCWQGEQTARGSVHCILIPCVAVTARRTAMRVNWTPPVVRTPASPSRDQGLAVSVARNWKLVLGGGVKWVVFRGNRPFRECFCSILSEYLKLECTILWEGELWLKYCLGYEIFIDRQGSLNVGASCMFPMF